MTQGVYAIRHKPSGKAYIGSSINIEQRWKAHRWALTNGRHDNGLLQTVWNCDGQSALEFVVLEEISDQACLLTCESKWKSTHALFNVGNSEPLRPMRGTAKWHQWRAKLSAAMRGRPKSPEAIAKTAASQRGRPKSAITRAKISATLTGRAGRPHMAAARQAISVYQRQRWAPIRDEDQRNTHEHSTWSLAVKERDHYTCTECGETPCDRKHVHAHHVKPFKDYPELRYVVSNGKTLCDACHRRLEATRKPLSAEHKASIAAGVSAARRRKKVA